MLELRDITIGYTYPLIKDGNATLYPGELVALLGRNGSGKSTLLRHLMGMKTTLAGEVLVDGKNISEYSHEERAKLLSIVTTFRTETPHLTAIELVTLGRAPYTNRFGRVSSEDKKIARKALEATGMEEFANRSVDKMSDGERQRVMVARAIAQETPIILLDEPTAFLDLPNRYDLALLLQGLAHREGKLVLFSTHELEIALQLCDKIMLIQSPELITLGREEMKKSGYIEALFSSTRVHFDPVRGQVVLNS